MSKPQKNGCPPPPPINYFPLFSEFGKSTKDFFTKGLQTGAYRVNIRDQMSKNIQATINGSHDAEKKQAKGDFAVKLSCPKFPGYAGTIKWNTSNVITQDIVANETFTKGLDMALTGEYNADKATGLGKFKTSYKHEHGSGEVTFQGGDPDSNPMVVGGNLVTGYQDFAIGGNYEFDVSEVATKKYNVAASYVRGPIKVFSTLENADLLWCGAVYKVDPTLEVGINGTYKSEPDGFYNVGAAAKYIMDPCTAVKVKADTDKIVTVGLEVKIKPPATLTMTTKIDGNKWNEGGHEIGIGVDIEV